MMLINVGVASFTFTAVEACYFKRVLHCGLFVALLLLG